MVFNDNIINNSVPPKTVVLNGCFDGLHAGHIYLLKAALGYGQVIVGLNTDASVKKLKGADRPRHTWEERAFAIQEAVPGCLIEEFDGDAVRFARSHNADLVIRGWDQVSERGLPCGVVRLGKWDLPEEKK
ncbi:Bifunctional protein HldE [uncultured archaeon]|nr:Bifunctional protein HldE [uncultured archaeon]